MPAKGKVSLTWQTIFCFIPIMDMVAAYRVKKLRKYLFIMIVFVAIPTTIVAEILFPVEEELVEGFRNLFMYYYGVDDNQFIYSVALQIGTIALAIFLIRRWSAQWNNQF